MRVTIVVCTYNRCRSLACILEDLARQRVSPTIEWRVLVVDNNSSDETRETVQRHVARAPHRFAYAFEATPGKSHALNTGVRLAIGDIVAFTDDDVRVSPDWLSSLLAAFGGPEVIGVGGRILPLWDTPPPPWLPSDLRLLRGPLVMFDMGNAAIPLAEAPFGANMAFRKEAFSRFGGFRTDLGPRPGSEIRGEDSEFCDRLLLHGETIRYEPAALAYHEVPADRLCKRFFLRWWFDKGRSEMRAQRDSGAGSAWPVSTLIRLAVSAAKWATVWLATRDRRRRFERKLVVWTKLGALAERGGLRRATA